MAIPIDTLAMEKIEREAATRIKELFPTSENGEFLSERTWRDGTPLFRLIPIPKEHTKWELLYTKNSGVTKFFGHYRSNADLVKTVESHYKDLGYD